MHVQSHHLSNALVRQCLNSVEYDGQPLVAAFYVGWPYFRVRARLDCRRMQRIPFTWLYALRAIQSGVTSSKDISDFLGVPERSAKSWLNQLVLRQAITSSNAEASFSLTELGKDFLDSPEVEKLVSLPTRLTWDCVKGEISEKAFDELRARDRRSDTQFEMFAPTRLPPSGELSLPECQAFLTHFLDELSEEFDGAEILNVEYSSKPARAIARLPVLLYGTSERDFEVKVINEGSPDNTASALVRQCPNFRKKLAQLFVDTSVPNFMRRAGVRNSDALGKFGFDPSLLPASSKLLAGSVDRFRTFPGQGAGIMEAALLESEKVVRVVITESRIIEWDAFRRCVADALIRGVSCEIIVVAAASESADRFDKLLKDTRNKSLGHVPQATRAAIGSRLKIVGKREPYLHYWMPCVIQDDRSVWCGTEMLPGSHNVAPHFGVFIRDKLTCKQIAALVSSQVLEVEPQSNPTVKVEFKKKRTVAHSAL